MSNKFKRSHGLSAKKQLDEVIEYLMKEGYIKNLNKDVKAGFKDQFSFQFLVKINEEEKWLIRSTTSYRPSRAKGDQYDACNLKRLYSQVKRAIVVYPDSTSEIEKDKFIKYRKKINDPRYVSYIDDVMSLDDLYLEIEDKALKNGKSGKATSLKGLNLEKNLVSIMNNRSNVLLWNGILSRERSPEVGSRYTLFEKVINTLQIEDTIEEINCTDDIPSLPSGGSPKTDIHISIKQTEKGTLESSFSCKRSSSDWVTVHQYSASDFIDVINIGDKRLQEAVRAFQKYGGIRKFREQKPILADYFENHISEYNESLSCWVYGGYGYNGSSDIQLVDYMFILINDETSRVQIVDIDKYIEETLEEPDGQFGTPFRWTYASGSKGENIQLKGRVHRFF